MDDPVTLAWAIAGLVLIAAELVIPGLVVMFLGCGALIVAGSRAMGWVDGWMPSFTLWFISSLGLVVLLRGLFVQWVGGQTERRSTDEDADVRGANVVVADPVGPQPGGRIHFRDSTWSAICPKGQLETGAKATIVRREGLTYVVEPTRD